MRVSRSKSGWATCCAGASTRCTRRGATRRRRGARATDAALCAHWAGLRSVHLGELERAKRELAVLLRELQLYAL